MRLFIVSNRLPVSIKITKKTARIIQSPGGLATGMESYLQLRRKKTNLPDHLWVGWPGVDDSADWSPILDTRLKERNMWPVLFNAEEIRNFYYGFCNDTLWPLFHYFPEFVSYNNDGWAAYREANERFHDVLLPLLKPDDVVWIHDYQLLLLPRLLRERLPEQTIGLFLHIPFPVFEMFRALPQKWRENLLQGMLGADLIGFHTYDYTRHFTDCVERMLGYEQNMGLITVNLRTVKADTFPMGIDVEKFFNASTTKAVRHEIELGHAATKDHVCILSVDRLDYTKGILKRLEAYAMFLEKYPARREHVVLMFVVVPSRLEVAQYQQMKEDIDQRVGKINGEFGTVNWTPIVYQFKQLNFEQLTALYSIAPIALVTPLRDGMNLIAKEYVAARQGRDGVLILSEMAGAAQELSEALIVNPQHSDEVADALEQALTMPKEEQQKRMSIMEHRLERYPIARWADDFLGDLRELKQSQQLGEGPKLLTARERTLVGKHFRRASRALFLLDYDGTLVEFSRYPQLAFPDPQLLTLITNLAQSSTNTVVLMSGRDTKILDQWFNNLPIDLGGEHGIFLKHRSDGVWKMTKRFQNDWKKNLLPIFRRYADRLPGSIVEEKEFSIAWHSRAANPALASLRSKELLNTLTHLTANLDVDILQGNRVVEARSAGANKGAVASYYLERGTYDFILAIGDDTTDEDIFESLPSDAVSIKVGPAKTKARFRVESHLDVRALLEYLLTVKKK